MEESNASKYAGMSKGQIKKMKEKEKKEREAGPLAEPTGGAAEEETKQVAEEAESPATPATPAS